MHVYVRHTWGFDVEPAGPTDLPAEEEVLEAGCVGAKHMGERGALQVRGQRGHLSLDQIQHRFHTFTHAPSIVFC